MCQDKIAAYDREIAPLLKRADELASQYKINLITVADVAVEEGEGKGHHLLGFINIDEAANGRSDLLVALNVLTVAPPFVHLNARRALLAANAPATTVQQEPASTVH